MEPAMTPDATVAGLNASFPTLTDLRNRPLVTSACYHLLDTAWETERASLRF